jgi:hypothetical protein
MRKPVKKNGLSYGILRNSMSVYHGEFHSIGVDLSPELGDNDKNCRERFRNRARPSALVMCLLEGLPYTVRNKASSLLGVLTLEHF